MTVNPTNLQTGTCKHCLLIIVSFISTGVLDCQSCSHDSSGILCWSSFVINEKSSQLSFIQFLFFAILCRICGAGRSNRSLFKCALKELISPDHE